VSAEDDDARIADATNALDLGRDHTAARLRSMLPQVEHGSDKVKGMAGSLTDSVGAAADQVSARAGDYSDQLKRGAHHLGDNVAASGRRMRSQGRQAKNRLLEAFYQQPIALGAIGIAVGAAIGGALPRTRTEDEVMGETRDQLLQKAEEVGREGLARVQKTAEAAVSAGRDEAERQGITPDAVVGGPEIGAPEQSSAVGATEEKSDGTSPIR
jgi:hypothetical protein